MFGIKRPCFNERNNYIFLNARLETMLVFHLKFIAMFYTSFSDYTVYMFHTTRLIIKKRKSLHFDFFPPIQMDRTPANLRVDIPTSAAIIELFVCRQPTWINTNLPVVSTSQIKRFLILQILPTRSQCLFPNTCFGRTITRTRLLIHPCFRYVRICWRVRPSSLLKFVWSM